MRFLVVERRVSQGILRDITDISLREFLLVNTAFVQYSPIANQLRPLFSIGLFC